MRVALRVVAIAIVGVAGIAQAQQPTPPQPRQGPPPQGRAGTSGRRQLAPMPGGPGMAQRGAPGMMFGPMAGGGIASMLLAHTAELKLTDNQLSRLAAIARRTDDRHKSMRASMDSLMRANRPQPGATPTDRSPMMSDQTRTMMDRMRDQERTDLRDALAVLTVDQQADAWMMRGARPGNAGGSPRARFSSMRRRGSGE